jgi:TolB-like protein
MPAPLTADEFIKQLKKYINLFVIARSERSKQ